MARAFQHPKRTRFVNKRSIYTTNSIIIFSFQYFSSRRPSAALLPSITLYNNTHPYGRMKTIIIIIINMSAFNQVIFIRIDKCAQMGRTKKIKNKKEKCEVSAILNSLCQAMFPQCRHTWHTPPYSKQVVSKFR